MAILVPLLTVVIDKLLLNGSINLITIIKLLFISKTFWFSIVNIFIISYTMKVNITYWDIIPIIYYNYCVHVGLKDNYYFYNVMYMMPNNNIRANKQNGAVFVNDPLNQNYTYISNGNNQPLLGNIGRGLEAQRQLGLSSLSKFTFTPQQEAYVLTFLLHNHADIYDNIMQGQTGNVNEPQWWKQSNTKKFNQLLINGT